MKITKSQLRRIIAEQIATVNDETIEDVVMGVLSDEGGAAGEEPIKDALEDLEDEEVELPDEPIEDIINDVPGVKRHTDGDYIDTTKLEGRTMKATLRRIIKEFGSEEYGRQTKEFEPIRGIDGANLEELLAAQDNLLGMIETMDPDAAGSFIENLVRELQTLQREM